MIEAAWRTTNRFRDALAGLVSLRWLRLGSLSVAVPAAMLLVVLGYADQLGGSVGFVPFWLAWLGIVLAVALFVAFAPRPVPVTGRSRAVSLLIGQVVAGWCLFDLLLWQQTNHIYDLDVYLGSAGRWLHGGQPYLTKAIGAWPVDGAHDFFLYPPPLLPLFGLLSQLPSPAVSIAWTAAMLLCAYGAFRVLGLGRAMSAALLAFPPVMIGVESRNVASLTFLLFALGFRAGGWLVLEALFKVQNGLATLWLLRNGRWLGLIVGVAIAGLIFLVTLPIVGTNAWFDWFASLGYRAQSQPAVPALFGFSYARVLPGGIFVALVVAAVVLALTFRGRRGLAAMGLASILASPSLWPHGFVFALPALLTFESGVLFWAILGAGSLGPNMWLLFYAGWLAVLATGGRHDVAHPLFGREVWPDEGQVRAPRRL